MNYVAERILGICKDFQKEIKQFNPYRPTDSGVIRLGLERSESACKQEEYVHPTPIMKNAMIVYGDVKQYNENGVWHTEKFKADGTLGKAATTLLEILRAAMIKHLGPELHEYPTDVPFTDPAYYRVDCWNFFDELPKKFWDIQPDQTKQLKERFKVYSEPKTNMSLAQMIRFIETEPAMQKALEIEQKIWPMVKASKDITAISDPFISKKTGVSYPDYANDSTVVPGRNITYGAYEIELAREAFRKGGLKGLLDFGWRNSVYTGYTRRQMGKGRALIAESRRSNLVVNMINAVEMEKVKDTRAIQIPFLSEDEMLTELSKIADYALAINALPVNIDASSWDQNLGEGPLVLQDAERYNLAQGEFSKTLVKHRMLWNTKAYFMNGPERKMHLIYGRQYSGYGDTTLGNTKANRITATCSAIKTSPTYVSRVIDKMHGYHIVTVGDDLLVVLEDRSKIKPFIEAETNDFHLVIHGDEKFAQGVFFIQWRVFKEDGKYTMAYNVPRVFRSMLSKEDAKHLGRGGWTLAYYQQLSKLSRYKPALAIVLNILAAFDQYHLSLDVPVKELLKMVQEEDKLAQNNGSKKRVQSTAERMYRSNPNISGLKVKPDGSVELDENFFVKQQEIFKSVYDPDYLVKLGFANPDLTKIK